MESSDRAWEELPGCKDPEGGVPRRWSLDVGAEHSAWGLWHSEEVFIKTPGPEVTNNRAVAAFHRSWVKNNNNKIITTINDNETLSAASCS